VLPRLDAARLDSIALQFARKAHTIPAAGQAMRAFEATAEHVLAAVTGL
jgi:hypothetical protein